jgi:lipopolysaccharide biosynthesis glycosyltransferase
MSIYTHIAFTICSNNYLGQALALKKSFLKHNPNFEFNIILVDEFSSTIDYTLFEPANVIPITNIEGIDLDDLISRYYIIELNTSVKPSVFKHLYKLHPNCERMYYLDPDLYFYDSLSALNTMLENKSAVLTPHILSPIPRDGKLPDENVFLQFGIYNLGFLGLNMKHPETSKLLNWWEERTLNHGYDQAHKGYFVDQLWMAHAPLFFKDVKVLTTYNYNMAPWNLHERKIVKREGDRIILNDESLLVFYHFSKITAGEVAISREFNRYILEDLPLLKELYQEYKTVLSECHFEEFRKISIAYPVSLSPIVKKNKQEPKTTKRANLLSRGLIKIAKDLDLLLKSGNK